MRSLSDKVIIITGAGGTIAGEAELAFRHHGARLVLVDRDAIRIQGRASSFGTTPVVTDMTSYEATREMVEHVRHEMGRIDGLVHLVGDIVTGNVTDLEPADYDRAFDTNVRTLFYLIKAVLPELLSRQEAFIGGIASQEAWGGGAAGASLFASAKSAVATLLRSLDAELSNTNVNVAIVFPMGPVDTLTNRRALAQADHSAFISPATIAQALTMAALSGEGGHLLELPIHPPHGGG